MPAPLGSSSMAMRPTFGTSKIGIIEFRAGLFGLGHARIDVIDREERHPAFGHAVELALTSSWNRPATGFPPSIASQ